MADKAPEKKPDAAAAPAKDAKDAPAKDAHGGGGAAPAGGAKKGGILALLTKTPVMLGSVMILEAIVLFAGFKFIGGGARNTATAGELVTKEEEPSKGGEHGEGKEGKEGEGKGEGKSAPKGKTVELQVLDFKAPNKQTGRSFLYDVTICVVTKTEFEDRVKNTIKTKENQIKDRVRTIIAQNDPEKMGGGSEPGLETLRRQVKHQLDELIGDGLIEEVLIPKCTPFRTDF